MLAKIAVYLVETVFAFFVLMLLARFHFQWLRVSFRNPLGEFVLATTSWMVMPARRVIPGLAGLDMASLLLAWALQALNLSIKAAILGAEPAALTVALLSLLDLARYSVYILMFAIIVQVVFSWINPNAPMAWIFNAITGPFLRPLRRFVPPVGNVDLSPLILLVILQVILFVLAAA